MKDLRERSIFYSKKRPLKKIRRLEAIRKKYRLSQRNLLEVKKKFGSESTVVRLVGANYKGDIFKHNGFVSLKIPKTFSIIENANHALSIIGQFAKTLRINKPTSIEINQLLLEEYDLAANALLDLIAVELLQESKYSGREVKWRGVFPRNQDVARFIKRLGIVEHLKLKKAYLNSIEAANQKAFDVRTRHYFKHASPQKADRKTQVVAKFADHINACLQKSGRELSIYSRHKLCEYTGEILDNAEQHAGMIDWTIQGYLDVNCVSPICEIAIFNLGKTIAETLMALDENSYTRKQIAPYLLLHRARKFFGAEWTEENLLTLMALQGYVSAKNHNDKDTRGNGTVDLIDYFQQIYEETAGKDAIPAKMAIVSGSTYIYFDGTYKLSTDANAPRKIAFNRSNSLYDPPDRKYVKSLNGVHFPGTIISVRFPLDINSMTVT